MAGSLTNDVIQLTLPLKPDYLPLLRTTVGVLAGTMSFRYDEIMQLRAAMSEVFELAVKQAALSGSPAGAGEMSVQFMPQSSGLGITFTGTSSQIAGFKSQDNEESRVLLESLVDTIELGGPDALVRLFKYRSE